MAQIRRLSNVKHLLTKIMNGTHGPNHIKEATQTWQRFQCEAQEQDVADIETYQQIATHTVGTTYHHTLHILVSRLITLHEASHTRRNKAHDAARNQAKRQRYLDDTTKGLAYKYVRNSFTPGLTLLQNDQGHLTGNPTDMDELLRSKWGGVMEGNSDSHVHTLLTYLAKYRNLLFRSTATQLAPLTGKDLMDTCLQSSISAGGMDGWGTEEFRLMPLVFFEWAATVLNMIETGDPWPADLLHHRSSCLLKDPNTPYNPLSYRILKIMPVLYRRWASTRLRHLGPWIQTWQLDSMFAGLPDRSADDAWFHTSIEVEEAKMTNTTIIGGAVDLFKCFDQLIRLIIYAILIIAGLPTRVLIAYVNYHEHVWCYFIIHGCIGAPHRFRCGIPQGCPLSMFLSLCSLGPGCY